MQVNVFDQQTDLKVSPASIKKIVSEVIAFEGQAYDEVDIHFVDTKRISSLHKIFFNDPSPTDCISLPMDDSKNLGYRILGEIFVCPKTALSYVEEHGGNPYEEATLYLTHGLLHLMGYDDIGDTEPAMRAAEKRHMENLKAKNLLMEE